MHISHCTEIPGCTIGRQAGANIRINPDTGRMSRSFEYVITDAEGYCLAVAPTKRAAIAEALAILASR